MKGDSRYTTCPCMWAHLRGSYNPALRLDGSGSQQYLPMRSAGPYREGRWIGEHLRTPCSKCQGRLGEAQVVARQQAHFPHGRAQGIEQRFSRDRGVTLKDRKTALDVDIEEVRLSVACTDLAELIDEQLCVVAPFFVLSVPRLRTI